MKFKVGDLVRIKKSAGVNGGSIRTIRTIVDDQITTEEVIGQIDISQLQLILSSPKLKLRLSQNGLKLKVKILEQDESLRNIGAIAKLKNYDIYSNCHP